MDENGWETLQSVQRFIFNISKEAPSQGEQLITDICNDKYKCSLNLIIFQMIYTCFLSSGNKFDLHINFLNKLNLIEGNKEENILKNFIHFLLRKYKQKSNYLIEYIINEKLIESKTIKNMKTLYFAHHFSKEEFNKDILPYCKDENIDELSKNDWELHKKLIKEGHSPNEIAKIIRNDEIEKLQEISSQSNFDFNQTIKPSLYERYSFINQKSVTLIDYAAFFSAEKCFKYLLMNGANAINTGKYAIAGGNLEIIHLCEQNHSSFEDACETAIKYHRNNIFQYIYESKMENLNNIELGKKCIIYHNYEIFTFLQEKGMKISNSIINEAARNGNIFLVKHFLKNNKIPNDILIYSTESGNIELVEYALQQGTIDRAKNNYGQTVLIIASLMGYKDIVKLLLEQKSINININDKDSGGQTALMKASSNNHIKIVKLLLEQNGININIQDIFGFTALILASQKGNIEVVKLLLEQKGIKINAKDNIGRTALKIAAENSHTEVVNFIQEKSPCVCY